jgi:hypothetical protein
MEINLFGFKFRLEILILIVIVYLLLTGHLFCSCCNLKWGLEGFKNNQTNYNDSLSSNYELGKNDNVDTSMWGSPDLRVTRGQSLTAGVQDILKRPSQPIPLPEGELDVFATTEFKPECCPNNYSKSTGCACMTVDQYNYIGPNRGGNNVPFSEY